jgi:hypothetical protein
VSAVGHLRATALTAPAQRVPQEGAAASDRGGAHGIVGFVPEATAQGENGARVGCVGCAAMMHGDHSAAHFVGTSRRLPSHEPDGSYGRNPSSQAVDLAGTTYGQQRTWAATSVT